MGCGGQFSGNHQGNGTVSARLMETQMWPFGGRARDSSKAPCQHFCLGESCPSMFCPDFRLLSSSPYVPGASLLELTASKCLCRPFKRNCLGLWKFPVSLNHNPCWFLSREVMETCLPGSGTLGWGAPCSPGGTSAADIHLLMYISLLGVGQARCVSPPLTPFSLGLLYILYRSRRASGQPISGSSE